jgi:hypothetical protein
MDMHRKYIQILKEMVEANLLALSQTFTGNTEENHKMSDVLHKFTERKK